MTAEVIDPDAYMCCLALRETHVSAVPMSQRVIQEVLDVCSLRKSIPPRKPSEDELRDDARHRLSGGH